MKRWMILGTACFIALGITTGSANASPGDTVALVETWYARYLGRPADGPGLRRFVREIRAGIPVDAVEANFLAGPEYYIRNGSNSIGFVRGLYRDVLGDLYPSPAAVAVWVSRLENSGSRQTVALGMLQPALGVTVVRRSWRTTGVTTGRARRGFTAGPCEVKGARHVLIPR